MAVPGWPELAFCTASMDSVRIVLMHNVSMLAGMLPPPSGALAGQGNNECIKPLSFILTAPIRNMPETPGRRKIRHYPPGPARPVRQDTHHVTGADAP
ncbi:hypothetical protein GHA01_02230 [Novacetimonas hansenii]|uniref:Uncharacterized protein n=1 Tax=Novacetimonas hansenii TaxID=436 RepID=A0ABQ0SB05_NOVHA|nr:hypothetical protein Gaha_0327_001 [Novacetimonas hansenii JCM 7643]GEC62374.1 hypothetical protein GHA01_02230 [Novacetimonas hansenii]